MNPGIVIGIDNGSSGSVAILGENVGPQFFAVPTQESMHYGKTRAGTTQRLDRAALKRAINYGNAQVFIERPYTGKFLNATLPAHRFFEATICTLEDLGLGFQVIDSRDWQSAFFPNVKGSADLKKASRLRGIELYPQLKDAITKQGDADGLLIAHKFFYRL